MPKDYKNTFKFLKYYKYTNGVRLFEHDLNSSLTVPTPNPVDVKPIAKKDPDRPLEHMKFVTAGKMSRSVSDARSLLQSLGGKHVARIDETVIALITTAEAFEKNAQKVFDAQAQGIHIVSEDFLNEFNDPNVLSALTNDKIADLINKHSLRACNSDVKDRMMKSDPSLKTTQNATKSSGHTNSTVKLKIKGGAAVDPESGLENEASVVREGDAQSDPYSVVLNLVDIVRDTNSYYKLQILKHDMKSTYYVFRAWGRTGSKWPVSEICF